MSTPAHPTILFLLLLRWSLLNWETTAFVFPLSSSHHSSRRRSVITFGISEWRDLLSDPLFGSLQTTDGPTTFVRQVPILLADSNQVVLQGETKYFYWNQDDEVRLFQQALDRNERIFGLGFVRKEDDDEEEILLDKIALMEILDYNLMGVDYGVLCSAKVVGRGNSLQAEVGSQSDDENDKTPFTAICAEYLDRSETVSLREANEMANTVEQLITDVSIAEQHQSSRGVFPSDDEDDDDGTSFTRLHGFRAAYQEALASDSNGYFLSSSDQHYAPSSSSTRHLGRSWRELNALSWAAFSTSSSLVQDEIYRLSALDIDLLTNRLQFAIYWLSDVLLEVEQRIE
jgi:hypothetical protein